jgi:outer membrane receptor protein involved in Fe transport
MNTSGATYNNILYASTITYGNPVLKWEKKQNKDLGLEMSFFKGRLNTEISYFNEKIENLLDQVQVPRFKWKNNYHGKFCFSE